LQTSSTQNNFDLLRLTLAVLVYFAHWNTLTFQGLTNSLFHLSGYSVHMFFIVSGFLIFWSFDNDQNKKHFYIKRFFRIFPLYAILITLQTLFFVGFSDGTIYDIVKYFATNILFLNFLAPSVGTSFSDLYVNAINGSLWTLKNEVVFYLFVPLVFMLYKKFGIVFLMILYSLSVFYMFGIDYIYSLGLLSRVHADILLFQFPAQVRLFMVGIFLYVMYEKMKDKNITLFALLSIVLIALLSENSYFHYAFYPLLLGVVMIWLVFFVKQIKINFDFSYSFYILHFPVIQLALYFDLNPAKPLVSFFVLFGVVLLLSYFSQKYIEEKFILLGKNIINRKNNVTT